MLRPLLRPVALAASCGLALGQTELSGPISDSTTGPLLSGQVYHLNGSVSVPNGQTLTVQAGAIVKGRSNSHLIAHGTIHVNGTAPSPVIFTSINDDTAGGDTGGDGPTAGAPGEWRGLYISTTAAGSNVNHAELWYGGQSGYNGLDCLAAGTPIDHVLVRESATHGINLGTYASPVTNCSLESNGGWALFNVPLQALPTFGGNTASGNVAGDQEYVNAFDGSDVTIGPDNCLNGVLYSAITINTHALVTFLPGMIVKSGPNVHWVFHNPFTANGTADDPIVFTAIADDDHGGDTLKDGPTSGTPGSWRGIYLPGTADGSSLSYVTVRYGGQSGYNGLDVIGATSTIDHCTLQQCLNSGLNFGSSTSGSTVTNCTFENNVGYAARSVPIHDLPGFLDNQSWGNTNGETIHTSGYNGATDIVIQTQNLLSDTLIVNANLSPSNGTTVTLEAGVVAKFTANVHSVVYGTLICNGTEADPVVFTSIHDDEYAGDTQLDGPTSGAPGDWRGIFLSSTADLSVLDHTIVRYGGAAGYHNIVLSGADATLSNCVSEYGDGAAVSFSGSTTGATVTNCAFDHSTGIAAAQVPLAQLPGLSGNTAEGNASNHTEVVSWTVTGSLSIDADNMIGDLLAVPGGMTIAAGSDFTINEGMVIKVAANAHFIVHGTLNLLGSRLEPIRMTSINDDSVFGDTNLGGGPPAHGDWRGIFLASTSTCTLRDVHLSYCGAAGYDGVVIQSPNTTLLGVRVDHSAYSGFGISALGSDTERLTAYDCLDRGIELLDGGFTLRQATCYGNANEGLYAHPSFTGRVTDSISVNNGLDNYFGLAAGDLRYSNGSPAHAGQDGNIDEDPLFVNPAAGNLTLFEASPCVDTADPLSPLDPDLTRADMGAFYFDHCRVRVFCDGKDNSLGCTPSIWSVGYPDLGGEDDLVIQAGNIPGQRTGYLLWSLDAYPTLGGVATPTRHGINRCLLQPQLYTRLSSGGTEGLCDGSFTVPIDNDDINTMGWLPGQTVHMQFIYPDPGQPDGTPWGHTPAILFQICP